MCYVYVFDYFIFLETQYKTQTLTRPVPVSNIGFQSRWAGSTKRNLTNRAMLTSHMCLIITLLVYFILENVHIPLLNFSFKLII